MPSDATSANAAGRAADLPNQVPQDQPQGAFALPPDDHQVAAVSRQIKLPPFCRNNPRLWFAQVELAFSANSIQSDANKFRFVAIHLSGEVLDSVSDIVLNPPAEGKYEALKHRIVTSYDEGDERRLRRLLRGNKLTDERPTAYLHRLRNLAGGQCSEPILRSLLMEQLPEQVRAILTIPDTQDLGRLAEMADRAMDAFKPSIAASDIASVQNPVKSTDSRGHKPANLHAVVNALQHQVEALNKRLDQELRSHRGRSLNRRQNSRSRSSPASSSDRSNLRLCYYHSRFGANARKCQVPCSFHNSNTTQRGN